MTKKVLGIVFLLALVAGPLMAGSSVMGLWKTVDDVTNETTSILKIYEYNGMAFGRILVIYDNGKVEDTYVNPSVRAENVKGEPFYAGLDIIWDLVEKKGKWKKGEIMDPETGKVYASEIWLEGGDLIVRGKIGPFGRNQTWVRASVSDLPPGTPEPTGSLVPVIPDN